MTDSERRFVLAKKLLPRGYRFKDEERARVEFDRQDGIAEIVRTEGS